MWNCCRHQRVARATGRPSGFLRIVNVVVRPLQKSRCGSFRPPSLLSPPAYSASRARHGRVEILEPILRVLWIRLAPVAIFLDNGARPSPALIGIVSAMTRRGRSAVVKSRPPGEPEGRDV